MKAKHLTQGPHSIQVILKPKRHTVPRTFLTKQTKSSYITMPDFILTYESENNSLKYKDDFRHSMVMASIRG